MYLYGIISRYSQVTILEFDVTKLKFVGLKP